MSADSFETEQLWWALFMDEMLTRKPAGILLSALRYLSPGDCPLEAVEVLLVAWQACHDDPKPWIWLPTRKAEAMPGKEG